MSKDIIFHKMNVYNIYAGVCLYMYEVELVTGRTGDKPVHGPCLQKKKKKSLWKWPDVTLPQCLPPHNSAAAWGARRTLRPE